MAHTAINIAGMAYRKLMGNGYTDINTIKKSINAITNGKVDIKIFREPGEYNNLGIQLVVFHTDKKWLVEKLKNIDYRPNVAHILNQPGIFDIEYINVVNWRMLAEDIIMATYRLTGGTDFNTNDLMQIMREHSVLEPKYYIVSEKGNINRNTIGVFRCNTAYDAMYRYNAVYMGGKNYERCMKKIVVLASYVRPITVEEWIAKKKTGSKYGDRVNV